MSETAPLFLLTQDGLHIRYWPEAELEAPPPLQPALCGANPKGGHLYNKGLPRNAAGAPDWSAVCPTCYREAVNIGALRGDE